MTTPVEHVDLRRRLPRGLSAVEASAGTGKTFALTALAVQGIVLDGVRTDQLLVVTFTRAAAAELRGRIRAGLRDATAALRTLAGTGEVPQGLPEWLDALCRDSGAEDDTPPSAEESARRASAAAVALSTLDRATITTLHGFCQAALTQLGLRGTGAGARFTTDVQRLRTDVVRDRLIAALEVDPSELRRSKGKGEAERRETPREVEKRVDQLVRVVLASDAHVAPIGPATEPVAGATARFAEEVVAELRARLDVEGELTFDELVRRMDLTLADGHGGDVAARQLRERLRLVLVDEMQDTDAVQWRILQRAFLVAPERLGPPSDVVIVGDPKQSIYRFRGADIDAYLAASAEAGTQQRSLGQNWRSSAPLLDALDALMRGARFGGPRIAYHHVTPGRPTATRVTGTGAPIELRWIRRDGSLPLAQDGHRILTDGGDGRVLDDLAARAVAMLREGRIVASDEDRARPDITVAEDGTRALAPRDLAVLVRRNSEASAVVERLAAAGVPAVQPKGGRVYDSDAFLQWRILLAALARPGDTDLLRALLLSWFIDVSPDGLDDDEHVEALHQACAEWRTVLATDGILALLAALRTEAVVAAALARAGERGLTDVEHLAELVHVAVGARGVLPAVALRTLEELALASDRGEDDTDDPAVRRIGSDGDATQVMTYHAAKGLEFPVVLLPYANRSAKLLQPWAFRSDAGRVVDAGSGLDWVPLDQDQGPDAPHARMKVRQQAARDEQAGDEARLLYVALTRARDRCLVWWWPVDGSEKSLLATLLFGERDEDGALLPGAAAPKLKDLDDATTAGLLAALAERAAGTIDVEEVPVAIADARHVGSPVATRERTAVATLSRDVHEPDVWRWSFTGLLRPSPGSAADSGGGAVLAADAVGGDVEAAPDTARGGTDEPDSPVVAAGSDAERSADDGAPDDGTSPDDGVARGALVDLPGGTTFGVLVHEVLEAVDLAAPAEVLPELLRAELAMRASRAALRVDIERLTEGLVQAARTPLDPLLPGLRLCDVPARDRIPELAFELPVADTRSRVLLADLAAAVTDALVADDPYRESFRTLPERVARARFAGWLTGVIDLALRTPDGRYFVADHKTNRLSDAQGRPAYHREAMHAAMLHGEYPLQALLYLVGMHRVLGRRLAGYDPAVHLGGAAFLFLRGMVGEATPLRDGVRDGVCIWRPTITAVLAADSVLAGGVR
jgi:exodeoxyribonuclease V beta subunit